MPVATVAAIDGTGERHHETGSERDPVPDQVGRHRGRGGDAAGQEGRPGGLGERLARSSQRARLDGHGMEDACRPGVLRSDRQDGVRRVPGQIDVGRGLDLHRGGDRSRIHRRAELDADRLRDGPVRGDRRRECGTRERDDGGRRVGDRGSRAGDGDDTDRDDESQATGEADPGEDRASQECVERGRDRERGGQQRNRGLSQ